MDECSQQTEETFQEQNIIEEGVFNSIQQSLKVILLILKMNGPIFTNKQEFKMQNDFNRCIFDSFNEQLNSYRSQYQLQWKPQKKADKHIPQQAISDIIQTAL